MVVSYPIYYEDAAHMVRILVDNGLRLDNGIRSRG